ncbi:MAG TPA: DUF4089 domain-containing protein [Stellaceae bacterium]|nr:DUF4089 domain-containing protein [Stellaceae bacterium]
MDDRFDVAVFVDAASGCIGLEIAPAHRPGVILNMERIGALAQLVMEFPLADEDEPAPVFRP